MGYQVSLLRNLTRARSWCVAPKQDPINANRPRNVFDLLFADVVEFDIEISVHLFPNRTGNADATRFCQCLEPGRDIYSVTRDVAGIDHDVAKIDADPIVDALVVSGGAIPD